MRRRLSSSGSISAFLPAAFFLLVVGAPGAAPPAKERADPLHERLLSLRRKSADAQPGTPQARAIAVELGEIGSAYLENGDTGRAVELLDEAYGWDSENGVVLALLTLAYVQRGDFPFARFYLDLAEQRAPRAPPRAYEILGEVYYSLNRLEDAVVAWEHFQRLGGESPGTLRRLSKVRQELALASGQRHLETEHFSFFWDPAISASVIERVADSMDALYREQAAFFGTGLTGSQIVILYGGRSYFSLVSVPDWVSGMFDGKIRVSIDPDGGWTPELSAVLAHELAHSFIRERSRDRAPGWIHEGIAQWVEGKRLTRADVKETFRGRATHTLAEMEGNLARRIDRAAARSNYVEALAVVEYVVERSGPGALVCIVSDLGDGLSLADAMRRETGLNLEELFRAWKEWARL